MSPAADTILVIKIGGSLVETGRAADILKMIAKSDRKTVVVPGGGAFADKVRDLQKALQFDDAAAHRLAMLGMHQMAELFRSLEPKLETAPGPDDIQDAWSQRRIPLWVPLPLMQADATIAQNWDTTSDTLAVRLAEIVSAAVKPATLIVLKSVDVAPKTQPQRLSDDGIVDRAFPAAVARSGIDWRIYGPQRIPDLALDLGVAVLN